MKFLFFYAALSLLGSLALHAVPSNIENAFHKKYPAVKNVKWKSEAKGGWEANYEKLGIKYRADFNAKAIWIETENNISIEQLPSNIKSNIEIKYGVDVIRDIEAVDSPTHGVFYDVEIAQGVENIDVMFSEEGKELDPQNPPTEKGVFSAWVGDSVPDSGIARQIWVLVYKFIFNLLTIFVYAYIIYYRRHHDHKMLFLLLSFNLFLFPIFLSSSLVTAGFGFTIFALLALVRLRSTPFDKAEISYLLGAISLTFVNTMLPAFVDMPAAAGILLTAYLADRPSLWRSTFQRIEVDYRMAEREKMLDHSYLRKRLSDELVIEVREVNVHRIINKEVKLTLMYRDLTRSEREERAIAQELERETIQEQNRQASLIKKQELAALTEKARLGEEIKIRSAMNEQSHRDDNPEG